MPAHYLSYFFFLSLKGFCLAVQPQTPHIPPQMYVAVLPELVASESSLLSERGSREGQQFSFSTLPTTAYL